VLRPIGANARLTGASDDLALGTGRKGNTRLQAAWECEGRRAARQRRASADRSGRAGTIRCPCYRPAATVFGLLIDGIFEQLDRAARRRVTTRRSPRS
jgi:hypothetical protein